MSRKERSRLAVMARVADGELSLGDAAAALGVSYRQVRRIRRRYVAEGDGGLVHRLRGRASNRKADDAVRSAVLATYRRKYAGFGPTLACEYLARDDGHAVSHDTLLRWLRAEGLFERRRQRGKHRSRRDRRRRRGELVQMDGSPHDWLEGRGGGGGGGGGGGAAACCLMVMVDDATGRTSCRFYARETTAAAFDVFGRYAAAHGLPRALYVDRAGIYRPDDPAGPPTQFGRAMAELGVELILANSPQAKGRVERMNRTLQDRLAKALRLAGVATVEAANAFLDAAGPAGFLPTFNDRFCVAAAARADAHRAVPADVDLSEVLCAAEPRAVGQDWCVQWRGRVLQVDASHEALGLAGRRVTVREKADGTLQVVHRGQALTWREVSRRPARPRPPKRPVTNNQRYVPPADHPFKRTPACGPRPAARGPSAAPPVPLRRGADQGTVLLR